MDRGVQDRRPERPRRRSRQAHRAFAQRRTYPSATPTSSSCRSHSEPPRSRESSWRCLSLTDTWVLANAAATPRAITLQMACYRERGTSPRPQSRSGCADASAGQQLEAHLQAGPRREPQTRCSRRPGLPERRCGRTVPVGRPRFVGGRPGLVATEAPPRVRICSTQALTSPKGADG